MPKNFVPVVVGIVVLVLFVLSGGIFIIGEGEQVVVTQFGRPVGEPLVDAGFYLKIPFIQEKHVFEKKIIRWDGTPNQIPSKEKKYIWVDTMARWKIIDALQFMRAIGSEDAAQSRLDDIIDAVVRDNISSSTLLETIRSTNRQPAMFNKKGGFPPITRGRLKITRDVLEAANKLIKQYGISLVDFRIKRINYIESVRQKVFERMISERNKIASEYRSQGEGKKSVILGNMEKELRQIQSIAYRKAQIIRGKADAVVTRMFGEAFNRDPDYYALIKTLDTYKKLPGGNSTLILSTESDFFKYLNKP